MFSIEMASRGSPVVTVRIPAELLELVDEIVARSADTRKDGPWTRSKSGSPLPESYGRDSSTF